MKLEFYEPGDFDRPTIEYFWDQGVDMDDWDYMIITHEVEKFMPHVDEYRQERLEPTSYELGNILRGCCDNVWYEIEWNGKPAVVGVAYHS